MKSRLCFKKIGPYWLEIVIDGKLTGLETRIANERLKKLPFKDFVSRATFLTKGTNILKKIFSGEIEYGGEFDYEK